MHFDIDDRVSLRGFRPEDRQDLVNGLSEWAVTRWLGRVPHPYRLDHADAFLARDEHLHVNEAVRDGSRSLSLALCHYDRVIGGFVLNPGDEAGVRELGFWLARPYLGQGIMRRAASHMIQWNPSAATRRPSSGFSRKSQRNAARYVMVAACWPPTPVSASVSRPFRSDHPWARHRIRR